MARTEGIYVEGNNVTEIPDGGSVRVEVFSSTQNHVTDTPLYTWPVSVQDGRFLIDIPQATTNQYPDKAQFSIVATMATGEKVRKLIAGPKGGTQLQRKGAIFAPAFITPNNTVFTGPELAFEWEGPPGAHYDLHVYTDAARTIKATDIDGNALDTVGIAMATSHTFTRVAENGATLYPRLYVWNDSTYSGTPAEIDITVTASSGTATFADFNTTLDGSTHTFTILNGRAGWRYDLVFDGSDTTTSVLWPTNTITRTGLPVDGGRYPVRLAMWPDGDLSSMDYADGFVTAYQQYSAAPSGTQIIIPGSNVSEGSYNATDWEAAIGSLDSTFWEANGTPVTSVTEFKGERSICVRLDSTSSPSTRMAAGADLDPSQELTIEQDIAFSDDFVWGGSNKGGKVGFGCGGGTRKSGGEAGPTDPDTQGGFTARLMWRATTESNGQMYAYLYHANTVGYGTDLPTGFYPKRGERFRVKTRVVTNSSAGVADGKYELWINDIKRIDLDDVEWFGTGTPQVDTLLTYNFHGGNDSTWSPPSGHVNRLYLSNIYYSTGSSVVVAGPDYDYIKGLMDSEMQKLPSLHTGTMNGTDGYFSASILYGLAQAFKATNDTSYLTQGLRIGQNWIDSGTDLNGDSYLDWNDNHPSIGDIINYDHHEWRAASGVADLLIELIRTSDDAGVAGRRAAWANFLKTHVWEKWEYGNNQESDANSQYWTSSRADTGTDYVGRWALVALALSEASDAGLITTSSEYRNYIESPSSPFGQFFPNYTSGFGVGRYTVNRRTDGNGINDWDTSHCGDLFYPILRAKQIGYDPGGEWSTFFPYFKAHLNATWFPNSKGFYAYVDGSGNQNGWHLAGSRGMALAAAADATLKARWVDMARNHEPTWTFWASTGNNVPSAIAFGGAMMWALSGATL